MPTGVGNIARSEANRDTPEQDTTVRSARPKGRLLDRQLAHMLGLRIGSPLDLRFDYRLSRRLDPPFFRRSDPHLVRLHNPRLAPGLCPMPVRWLDPHSLHWHGIPVWAATTITPKALHNTAQDQWRSRTTLGIESPAILNAEGVLLGRCQSRASPCSLRRTR